MDGQVLGCYVRYYGEFWSKTCCEYQAIELQLVFVCEFYIREKTFVYYTVALRCEHEIYAKGLVENLLVKLQIFVYFLLKLLFDLLGFVHFEGLTFVFVEI